MKYVIISNWSTKDQAALHAESEADGIGKAQARLSLTGDMALLSMGEARFEEGGNHFGDADFQVFTLDEIKEELDTPVWSEEVSEGGQIAV